MWTIIGVLRVDGYVVVREKVKILISFTNAVMVMFLHYVRMQSQLDPTCGIIRTAILPQLCDEKLYQTLLELAAVRT
jgi:hypothetical protein